MKSIIAFAIMALFLVGIQADWTTYIYEGQVFADADQEVMPFVTVQVKGGSHGTTTDIDGKFRLELNKPCATLEFIFVGYSKISQKACAADGPIKVSMQAGEMVLHDVVVEESRPKYEKQAKRLQQAEVQCLMVAPSAQAYNNLGVTTATHAYVVQDNGPVHNTEDYDFIKENRFLEVGENPLSTFSIDVDAASYSNMRRFINNGQQPPVDAIRIEEMVNYFDYEYPQPRNEAPFEVITEVAPCPWKPENRLLHIGLQGRKIATDNLPASNIVFLIDASGSMRSANKMPLLKASFKMLVDQLREQDRVAIVVYAGAAGLVLPSTSGANKQKIKEALDQLSAGGSTAGGAGIQLAYKVAREQFIKGGNNRVILATDGDFNIGQSSDSDLVHMIEKERESGTFLTVLGYGMGNYKDNKMQKLADHGNGNHAYIDNIAEAKKVLVNEFGGTLFTIAKDVKLQIEFNPAKVRGYRLIGYENRLLNKEDFNDDQKDAGELGSGHTVTALYEIIPASVENSPYLTASVDELKYQKPPKVDPKAKPSPELMTIKLRYKRPDGQKSQLMEKPVLDTKDGERATSDNFRFSAAVAQFGMLLRDSAFKGESNYVAAAQLARSAKGADPNGYRSELIQLIEVMGALTDPQEARK
ncbi:MAG: von Willebrand factor type A domain-containing protein [Bacteroidota bacterium]